MQRGVDKVGPVSEELPLVGIKLAECKDHLRITDDVEDDILRVYLRAAIKWAENYTRRAIVQRQFLIQNDAFPSSGSWDLPLGNITAIGQVQYIDTNGATQTWSSSLYESDLTSTVRCRLRPVSTESWPTIGDYFNAAQITVTAGWGQSMPAPFKEAIYLKTGLYFDIRSGLDPNQTNESLAMLILDPYQLPVIC